MAGMECIKWNSYKTRKGGGGDFFCFFADLKYTIVSHTKDFYFYFGREMILIRHIFKKRKENLIVRFQCQVPSSSQNIKGFLYFFYLFGL
jgi:hypothetical protein